MGIRVHHAAADDGAAAGGGGPAPEAAASGSLLETAKPAEAVKPAEGAPAAAAPEPGFLGGKYKTAADFEAGYKELQRAHTELTGKLKGFVGAPEKYELSVPEDLKGQVEWSNDHPLLNGLMEKAKGWGMSQPAFTEALHMLAQYELANATGDLAAEKAALGENADQQLTDFTQWMGANLDDERGAVIKQALTPNARLSTVFKAMQTLVGLVKQPTLKPDEDTAGGMTVGELDRKYRSKDTSGKSLIDTPEGRKAYRAELARIVGTGEHIEVMGKR